MPFIIASITLSILIIILILIGISIGMVSLIVVVAGVCCAVILSIPLCAAGVIAWLVERFVHRREIAHGR